MIGIPYTVDITRSFQFLAKRALDISLAVLVLIALSPLLLIIAIAIKLDSRGPVIFSQERVGARLKSRGDYDVWEPVNFKMYKFRSMVTDADESVHRAHIQAFVKGNLEGGEDDNLKFKLVGDPRVTRVGRILRHTSLDELPQMFNVIKGEMSLVGPRPVPVYEASEYQLWHCERLAAMPGITGLWQVKGRSQVSFEDMIRMDIQYVRTSSLTLDIKILLMTVPAVVAGKGAA